MSKVSQMFLGSDKFDGYTIITSAQVYLIFKKQQCALTFPQYSELNYTPKSEPK